MTTKLTASQIVQNDKEAIYLGNTYTVEADLDLPTEGKLGSKITWHSDSEWIIENTGKVHRPEFGKGNRKVELTATITYEYVSDTRTFEVTVLELEQDYTIVEVTDVTINHRPDEELELPLVVIVKKDDGSSIVSDVEWEDLDPNLDTRTPFTIEGSVQGTDIKAKANIVIDKSPPDHKAKIIDPSVKAFELDRVKIVDNLFSKNRDRGQEFLLTVDDDRMLYNFRQAAGLDVKNADPMIGWDAPESKLKGHTTGHYLSALAYAYKGSGNEEFKKKIDYMISELGKCQNVMEASSKFNYGFLSGYSEKQFDLLEEYTVYPEIWAPYYTLHKIFAGLLDCYEFAENEEALNIAKKLGIWVFNRLNRLNKKQLNKMWSMYIAGEYGGMNEVMARLYGITKNKDYLKAATFFDNEKLFMPMENNINTLGDMHANQHIPQVVGALKIYEVSKNLKYYNIAENFWKMVANEHIYNIGGTGEAEMFRAANQIGTFLTEKTAETCATYNMLKLTKDLFAYDPKAEYMDYYERGLYNHILASQDQSGPVGGSTYFMPLCPGGVKTYDEDGNSCCHGTGLENHVKYQESIYFHSQDSLFIILYIPSQLNWKEKNMSIIQSGDLLADNKVSFEIKGAGKAELNFRVPYWATNGFSLKINGEDKNVQAQPSSYVSIDREWADGDRIEIYIPISFRIERTPDVDNLASILYGPLVMVAKSDSTEFIELNINEENISNKITTTEDPLVFKLGDLLLMPNYAAWNVPYHAYFKLK